MPGSESKDSDGTNKSETKSISEVVCMKISVKFYTVNIIPSSQEYTIKQSEQAKWMFKVDLSCLVTHFLILFNTKLFYYFSFWRWKIQSYPKLRLRYPAS